MVKESIRGNFIIFLKKNLDCFVFRAFFCYDNLYVAKNWARVLKSERGSRTLILPNRNHENKELYTPMTKEGWEGEGACSKRDK